MEKSCSLHNNPVIAICLFKSCERSLLCLKCLRDHDENHDSMTYNVYDLMNKENWVETYEKQRDDLISKEKEISSQKAQVVSKSQELFKLMLDPVTKAAEEQKERLLEELKEMIDAEKHQEVKELFSKLEGDIEKLEKINFRDGDHFEKISQVKAFNESTMLNTIDVIRQAEDTLQGWVIDEGKLKMYKEELTELLQSIHLKDLLSSTPFKSLKETDTFFALRMTNEQLEEQLKTRAEQSEKSVQVETQLENDEIPKQMAKDYLEKDEIKAQNSQLIEIITSLRANIEEMNEKNEELKNQNAILNREVNQLVEELRPIRRRSNMHLHSQSMADISIASISSNGLFG